MAIFQEDDKSDKYNGQRNQKAKNSIKSTLNLIPKEKQ
jgi:hypothetical protein